MKLKKVKSFLMVLVIAPFFSIPVLKVQAEDWGDFIPASQSLEQFNIVCEAREWGDKPKFIYTGDAADHSAMMLDYPEHCQPAMYMETVVYQGYRKCTATGTWLNAITQEFSSCIHLDTGVSLVGEIYLSVYIKTGQYYDTGFECTNSEYPYLVGELCYQDVPNNCSFDMPIFNPRTSISIPRLCVPQEDGSYCEYETSTNSNGSNNYWSYTPTSESCNCEAFGSIPCVEPEDSNPITESDQNDCIAAGSLLFCPADPEDRCATDEHSITICEPNCGFINDIFYCGDEQAPETDECKTNDTREICSGRNEGECPSGYNCDPDSTGTTPSGNGSDERETPCTANDTRPECDDLPEGTYPSQQELDLSGIEQLLEQGNNNTNSILKELKGSPSKIASLGSELNQSKTELQQTIDDARANEQEFMSTSTDEESNLISDATAKVGYFGSIVSDLFPSTSDDCVNYVIPFPDKEVVVDLCSKAPYLKMLLAWFINAVMALYLFGAFTRAAPSV